MSHKNARTLQRLFAHPIDMNIRWRDVVRVLESRGAELTLVKGGRERVRLNGLEHVFRIPHGKLIDSRDEIMQIRHFLEQAGIGPDG